MYAIRSYYVAWTLLGVLLGLVVGSALPLGAVGRARDIPKVLAAGLLDLESQNCRIDALHGLNHLAHPVV